MLWFGQIGPLVDRCSPQGNYCLSRAYLRISNLYLNFVCLLFKESDFHLPLRTCMVRFKWDGTSKCSNFLMFWFCVNPWVTRPECSSLNFKGIHGLELFSILHLRTGFLMNIECIAKETGEDFISIPFHSMSPCTGRWCRPSHKPGSLPGRTDRQSFQPLHNSGWASSPFLRTGSFRSAHNS